MFKRHYALMAAAMLGMSLAPAIAQAQEAPAIKNGSVSLGAGFDITTEYWFRGIPQENQGFLIQPYADVTFSLVSNDDFTLDAYFGTWNSFHWSDGSSTGGNAIGNDNVWYEADYFIGATIGIDAFSIDFGYTNLYSPAGGVEFAEEIYIGLGFDDSELWGEDFGGLQPSAMVVFEIDGGSDSPATAVAAEKGIYFQVAVEPSFTVLDSEEAEVTLAIPVTLGFGNDDYYQYTNSVGATDDDTFGFFQIGAVLSMPLDLIPAEYGAYEVSAGIHYIALGDAGEAIGNSANFGVNGGDDDSIFATIGISMSY